MTQVIDALSLKVVEHLMMLLWKLNAHEHGSENTLKKESTRHMVVQQYDG